jgi:hypothetical protein
MIGHLVVPPELSELKSLLKSGPPPQNIYSVLISQRLSMSDTSQHVWGSVMNQRLLVRIERDTLDKPTRHNIVYIQIAISVLRFPAGGPQPDQSPFLVAVVAQGSRFPNDLGAN